MADPSVNKRIKEPPAHRDDKTGRPADQFLTNSAGHATVTSVTRKTHSTPTARKVKVLDADDPRHGTIGGYTNYSCRCDECRAANNAHQADYMRRHPEQREKHRLRQQAYREALKA